MSLIVPRVGTTVQMESVVTHVETVVIILFHMAIGEIFVKGEG